MTYSPGRREERVSVTVVLAGVTDVPRLDGRQRYAVDSQTDIHDQSASYHDDLESLSLDEVDLLEPPV